ncbi:MAG: class I SAM-dependent methyltransferase, partial [Anaerolineae bacterium]|nr:class I SAM-dependent methyltransferase [Anaerolineae bacterium]
GLAGVIGEILKLFVLAAFVAGFGVLLWWLLIASEGVYLGRRVVIWLYDLYAHRYDGVKNYYREYEQMYLAKPIMEAIAPHRSPMVLDVATGTGRLPLALMQHPAFQGRIVGVDLSRQMLRHAAKNLDLYAERVDFLWSPAERLPFADNTFDLVTSLEALEFMSNPKAVLAELVRVLRPGGLLLISQRQNTRFMPGKIWTSGEIQTILAELGVDEAKAQIWQVDYRKVWGHKAGQSNATGARPLGEILRCPSCNESMMHQTGQNWVCDDCAAKATVDQDGVIELFPLY